MIIKLLSSLLISTSALLFASSKCPDISELKLHNGHYYGVTTNTMTFDEAKKFSESKGGYLAIPNNAAENSFLKNILGGRKGGWIGVYDPTYSTNYSYSIGQKINTTRFKDIKGKSLSYSYWEYTQPDNLIEEYDTYNGVQRVSPLGEHWVSMDGNSGRWWDYGNHLDSGNAKFYALLEFDTAPVCFEDLSSNVIDTFTNKKCSTQIWDDKTGHLETGSILDCRTDIYNNTYCPSALALCGQEWDYENGYSIQKTGIVDDYMSKICDGVMINGICYDNNIKDATKVTNLSCVSRSVKCTPDSDSCCHIDISCSGNSATIKYYDCCSPQGSLKKTVNISDANQFLNGVYYQPYGGSQGKIICTSNGACSIYFQNAYCGGNAIGSPFLANTFSLNTTERYICNDTGYVNGSQLNADPKKCYNRKILTCPSGYTETTGTETAKGECKKTIEYTYYNYLCGDSKNTQGYNYLPINSGGNCNKTDPNNTTINSSTLDDPCNSQTPPTNNCKREKFMCQANNDRPCSYVDDKWQCSPFPCFGENDITPEGTVEGTSDKNNNGWGEDGMCNGQIHIFNGRDRRCRNWDMFFGLVGGGCCDKDKVFAGLVACKENEKLLAKQNKAELCTELGEYCSKKMNLGFTKICIQKSLGHCCFGSKLARFVHEQGRSQIGLSWGSAENPQCRGFTPEEFQKLDFSKINLAGAFDIPQINQTDLTNKINSTVNNFKNMLGNSN
ncbi:MAG: conjugal transfer protein TraN [Aliarcobacter sp.]|nr:conjugal transfer protein TraN [Aliarcobacter sp.]